MASPTVRILLKDHLHSDIESHRLCIDAGPKHLALVLLLLPAKSLLGFEFYSWDDQNKSSADIDAILMESPLMSLRITPACVVSNTNEAVLIPDQMYNPDYSRNYLEVVHGDVMFESPLLQEHISGYSLFNVYQEPVWLQQLSVRFRNVSHLHIYSVMLSYIRKKTAYVHQSAIYAWFYPEKVHIAMLKGNQITLLQTFFFDIPEDISYALLNACELYQINPADVHFEVSGYIKSDSLIFTELVKYFSSLSFDAGDTTFTSNDFFSNYPAHLFTPFYVLSTCE